MAKRERVALVTGANRGVGYAAVELLAERGFHVVLTARDAAKGEAARRALAGTDVHAELRRLDVTRSEEARSLAGWIRESFGHLDVLVNNAGIMSESRRTDGGNSSDPLKVSTTTVLEHFDVNTLGAVRTIQALGSLLPAGGRVINVSSGMGRLAEMGGGYLAYRLSKAALNAATIVFANELRARRVGVYGVCPGWVRTGMGGREAPRSPQAGADTIAWLAAAEPAPESGRLYRDRKAISW